jgi:serine O-acetyltransferase
LLNLIYPKVPSLFLDYSCHIGAGLFIQHGFSTMIMADMGKNCWVNQQVTIGYKDKSGRPKIGNNVRITAGAKVIGNIQIGDNVTVGANAVVVKNVPSDCVVAGVPASIIKRNGVRVTEKL